MKDVAIGHEFEWVKNEKNLIYQNTIISLKIKREKLDVPRGEADVYGYEVYLSDDPRTKQWRPLRFFKEDNENAIDRIMKWVERFAERLNEDKDVELRRAE